MSIAAHSPKESPYLRLMVFLKKANFPFCERSYLAMEALRFSLSLKFIPIRTSVLDHAALVEAVTGHERCQSAATMWVQPTDTRGVFALTMVALSNGRQSPQPGGNLVLQEMNLLTLPTQLSIPHDSKIDGRVLDAEVRVDA